MSAQQVGLLLAQLLGVAWAFLLPGVLLLDLAHPEWPLPLRLAGGFLTGVLVISLASFVAAWLLATSIRAPLVLGVATLVSLLCFALGRQRARGRP